MSPTSAKRRCGICGKSLSQYNQDEICMSHKAEDVSRYRENKKQHDKESRAILAFIKEFHGESTPQEMLAKAKRTEQSPARRRAVTELERYPEALGLLKVASLIFRLSMHGILRKGTTSPKPRVARDVLSYVMTKDLGMSREDIAIFLGYKYVPRVAEGVERIERAMLEDEDLILAVDLVRDEHAVRLEH